MHAFCVAEDPKKLGHQIFLETSVKVSGKSPSIVPIQASESSMPIHASESVALLADDIEAVQTNAMLCCMGLFWIYIYI